VAPEKTSTAADIKARNMARSQKNIPLALYRADGVGPLLEIVSRGRNEALFAVNLEKLARLPLPV
jgi:hypothetical protein